ncbi:hypothetical protein ACMA1I_12490 [Pontibacter sp. 13R65]|uniref:hypothetical protein n=1 Tax=Pontibacter sp. 13R65 TaxID=3127458 RepID=UPI00301B8726
MNSRHTDFISISILLLAFTLLYYPVWIAEYVYTDEVVQLWYYGKDPDFHMFVSLGRYITDVLMGWLFGSIDTIAQIKVARIFSFLGWAASIPVWYLLLKDIFKREQLPQSLAFLSVFYLICMPPLSISVLWASCLELFLANTCGFVAGYLMYRGTRLENGQLKFIWALVCLSAVFGIVALFTYQNGFGFFFLPFIIHALRPNKNFVYLAYAIVAFACITGLYFLIFKLSMSLAGMGADNRAGLHIYPWDKLKFFFTRPMSSAFHLTYLFNEKSIAGYIVYAALFGGWLFLYWLRNKGQSVQQKVISLGFIFALLMLSYLPSMVVKENYASNRTLLALHLAVFILIAECIFFYFKKQETQQTIVTIFAILFLFNARYNVQQLYLKPVQQEYTLVRDYIVRNYKTGMQTVNFVQPQEDFFVRQYGITRSWDEFGVPSTFFSWVPAYFMRQVVFEITGDRSAAEALQITQWPDRPAYEAAGTTSSPNTLFLDIEEIIKASSNKSLTSD